MKPVGVANQRIKFEAELPEVFGELLSFINSSIALLS
jgi:hypothetical protein